MIYKIKNWDEFQHYRDGRPVHWIKLHKTLLNDYKFNALSEVSQLHLIKLWLMAADNEGVIEGDASFLAASIHAKKIDISALEAACFLVRTDSYGDGYDIVTREEKRREEKKGNGTLKIPENVNPESWQEFEQHRREIRSPLSLLAREKAMKVVAGLPFDEQASIIDQTIQNRWKGLFKDKKTPKGTKTFSGAML